MLKIKINDETAILLLLTDMQDGDYNAERRLMHENLTNLATTSNQQLSTRNETQKLKAMTKSNFPRQNEANSNQSDIRNRNFIIKTLELHKVLQKATAMSVCNKNNDENK